MQELERKFLLQPSEYLIDWKKYMKRNNFARKIEQYYILVEDNKELRIRKSTKRDDVWYEMTIKEGGSPDRQEITFQIDEAMYNYQKEKAVGYIEKLRIEFKILDDLIAEVDFFDSFIMAEIEFKNGYRYMELDKDIFVELNLAKSVEEVTCNHDYRNVNLATH